MAIEIKSDYLDQLQIATPCRANWQRMEKVDGKDSTRFCQSCQKNVYKLSLMSREEAMALLREKDGEICARLSRRKDGTVIFGDCPVGQSTKRQRRRVGAVVTALLLALVPSPVSHALKGATASLLRATPFAELFKDSPTGQRLFVWLDDAVDPGEVMGALPIAWPPAPPPTTPPVTVPVNPPPPPLSQ